MATALPMGNAGYSGCLPEDEQRHQQEHQEEQGQPEIRYVCLYHQQQGKRNAKLNNHSKNHRYEDYQDYLYRSNGGIVEPAYIRPADLRGIGATDRQRASDHGHYRFRTYTLRGYFHGQSGRDQPINNTIRLKPKETGHEDGELLAVVTIVTERYRTQYALL